MLDHLGRKGCKGNVLVTPARDQHDLLGKARSPAMVRRVGLVAMESL